MFKNTHPFLIDSRHRFFETSIVYLLEGRQEEEEEKEEEPGRARQSQAGAGQTRPSQSEPGQTRPCQARPDKRFGLALSGLHLLGFAWLGLALPSPPPPPPAPLLIDTQCMSKKTMSGIDQKGVSFFKRLLYVKRECGKTDHQNDLKN